MTISAIASRITRRIHAAAVGLHIQSLRLAVAAADAKVARQDRAVNLAEAAAYAARSVHISSIVEAGRAAHNAAAIRTAAQAEARLIGGAL